ncbi:WD40/YVTN/BNR-like repeat-containing protein [Paenibacillus dakarensis]|uniref:WD40/YVTN/BNR-like repeat-containing protein n=1 Tax=Paenibacillus dakarensis TaxID=1527293 RepID=UPI000A4AF320|nr:hypothetical protein [Paenibacillus dakarensis]
MNLRKHSYSLSILVLLLLLMTACSSDTEPAAVQQRTLERDTESVEDGQTLTVITNETEEKASKDKGKYQIQTRLTDFHMLNESEGIAWGLTKTALRLYLTEDYGETWVNISPSSNIHFVDKLEYGKDIFFTDKDHGWIVRNAKGRKETVLLNTSNGGREWQLSSLPGVGEVTALSFTSSMRGWVMSAGVTSPGSQEKSLFLTSDNGGKWTNIMENTDYPTSRMPGTIIPRTGHLKGMTFANSSFGLATIKETRGSKLYITRDGGLKWSSSKYVFQDEHLKNCDSYITGIPQFLGNTDEAWVPLNCTKNQKTYYSGYFSTDSGETWDYINFSLKPVDKLGTLSPIFKSLKEGWSVINGIVYYTKDMGKTWTAFPKDPGLTKHLAEFPIVSKMQFASSEVGWMLVETTDGKRSRLLQSMDGGQSWRIR